MRVKLIDRIPQGDPETVVLLPRGSGSLIGLHIRGVGVPSMLGIREDELGRPEACAITNELHIDTTHPRPVHGYGWVDEGGD